MQNIELVGILEIGVQPYYFNVEEKKHISSVVLNHIVDLLLEFFVLQFGSGGFNRFVVEANGVELIVTELRHYFYLQLYATLAHNCFLQDSHFAVAAGGEHGVQSEVFGYRDGVASHVLLQHC